MFSKFIFAHLYFLFFYYDRYCFPNKEMLFVSKVQYDKTTQCAWP